MVRNPFVFIVGCPRSGTTMLRRIFDTHPQISISPETHWIPRYRKEGIVTKEFLTRLAAHRRFKHMKFLLPQLEQLFDHEEQIPYDRFVTNLFDLYGRSKKKNLVGDKTPTYVADIDLLHELWPAAKFIHLIRDGRAVCLSLLDWRKSQKVMRRFTKTWREEPVVTAGLFWKWRVQLGREKSKAIPAELYTEVRYEALVGDPRAECSRLCHFLGIPYDEVMLEFHKRKPTRPSGSTANSTWLPITRGLRDWKSQMPPEQIELFEATAGDLLNELGYPRSFPNPSREKSDQASKTYISFTRDLQSQNLLLPDGW